MKSTLLIILLIVLNVGFALSQKPMLVKGNIYDSETGEPISGVNIQLKGDNSGTTSDKNGFYSISLMSSKDILVYSHIAYATVEKSYSNSNFKADLLLDPMINILPMATVKPVINISKGMLLDVTDYYFMGDSILYSGYCYRYNKKNNPWLVLIGPKGDTIFSECVGTSGMC